MLATILCQGPPCANVIASCVLRSSINAWWSALSRETQSCERSSCVCYVASQTCQLVVPKTCQRFCWLCLFPYRFAWASVWLYKGQLCTTMGGRRFTSGVNAASHCHIAHRVIPRWRVWPSGLSLLRLMGAHVRYFCHVTWRLEGFQFATLQRTSMTERWWRDWMQWSFFFF